MTAFQIVLLSIVLVLLYTYARIRISSLVQPMRLELVDRAHRLLAHDDLHDRDRAGIEMTLDRVFSSSAARMFAALVFPVSVKSGFNRLFHRRERVEAVSRPHQREIVEFMRTAIIVVLSNSPAATVLFCVSVLLSTLALLPVKTAVYLSLKAASQSGHHDNHPLNGGRTA